LAGWEKKKKSPARIEPLKREAVRAKDSTSRNKRHEKKRISLDVIRAYGPGEEFFSSL
jgi:hypothetical protein